MNGLTRIFLGGRLGQLFGKEWSLAISSPAEALHAINVNTGGKLKEYLRSQKRDSYYRIGIRDKYNSISSEEIRNPSGQNDIFIFPTASGRNNVVRIIVGVVLIIVGALLYAYGGGVFVKIGFNILIAGIATTLGGIVGLLTPVGSSSDGGYSEATGGSNIFANGAGVVGQGLPVRLVYGRALITASDTPISISYSNFDQNPNYSPNGNVFSGGAAGPVNFPNGYYYGYDIVDPTDGFPFYVQTSNPVAATPPSYA